MLLAESHRRLLSRQATSLQPILESDDHLHGLSLVVIFLWTPVSERHGCRSGEELGTDIVFVVHLTPHAHLTTQDLILIAILDVYMRIEIPYLTP